MKELPILFSTPMVQAILEGRKTMTIRTRGLEKVNQAPDKYVLAGKYHILTDSRFEAFFANPENMDKIEAKCYYGLPGDVLWVRESFCKLAKWYGYKSLEKSPSQIKWKPSIHMPKAAARIWLQVEEIRVERLLEITEEDSIAEGVEHIDQHGQKVWKRYDDYYIVTTSPVVSFWSLWASINGEDSWNANPWVWVVKFKVLSTTGKPQLETRNP